MESAYIVYYPDLAVPGARAAIRFFADQAVQSGVRRLVLLSGRCEEEALLSEQALQGLRRRLDNPAFELVLPELQRGFPARG
jgi:hypothetical protein